MNLISQLIISLVITAIASSLTSMMLEGQTMHFLNLPLTIAFFAATAATAIIIGSMARPATTSPGTAGHGTTSTGGAREAGTVKWFNVSKGFGFIIKEDGEEIFVHFRSIRGEGRRSLRDGQKVSFVVAQSEKGPQAEDVVAEN